MPYLVIDTPPQYPCDALLTYLTTELSAVLTSGVFGDAPSSKGLHELFAHLPAYEMYAPAVRSAAMVERHLRLKPLCNPEQQWLIDTDGIISTLVDCPGTEAYPASVWTESERVENVKDEMRTTLQMNMKILGDFDCPTIPDLTVCIRPDNPGEQAHLELAVDVWQEFFPENPVMIVDPEVDYKTILQQLGQ